MDPAASASAAASPSPNGAGQAGRAQRRVRNYLVDTPLQLRLASYLLGAAVLLSAGLGWLLWSAYQETSRVVALGAPEAGDALAQALASEDRGRILLVSSALAGVLVCLLGAAVVITHRIAGPAFAIARTCRRVGQGRLARPHPLRSRDLLVGLATEVATMIDQLRAQEVREREVALAAAATLRRPSADAGERGAAAEALERLARDKEARLAS
jgi:hypothetical protein